MGKGGGGASSLQGPSPRSASHVSAHADGLYVYGGYCKYAGDGEAGRCSLNPCNPADSACN